MGVKKQEFQFLQMFYEMNGPFGNVLTLGKQQIYYKPQDPQNLGSKFLDSYCIDKFGATSVTSIDYSNYEGANIIHDLQNNLPLEHEGKFDLVIDFGTTEHIFDVAASFKNCISAVKINGYLIHGLPSNNSNGHGFYQLSPEVFFSLYSGENGFGDTRVFVVDRSIHGKWYELFKPEKGQRLNVLSRNETYVFCFTRKMNNVSKLKVFQSDYVSSWSDLEGSPSNTKIFSKSHVIWKLKRLVLRLPLAYALREYFFKKNGIIHVVPDQNNSKKLNFDK